MTDDSDWLRAQIDALTTLQEAGRDDPWAVADAPDDYVAAQLRGIAGVEIAVERIEGKWKTSQNQPAANRDGVIAGLRDLDPGSAMAAAMARQ